jgi:hypothetical protein
VLADSGSPFNIVLAEDLNGDQQFNDRPTFATDLSRPSVVKTAWGVFDTAPLAGQRTIPINYGTGPAHFMVNARLAKSFRFGPSASANAEGGPRTDRRYDLALAVDAQNVFNTVNLAQPVGTLGSPLFGKSNAIEGGMFSSSANRVIQLEARFAF